MRIFESAAKHPIITISTLVGLNVLAVLILVLMFPIGRILNGEQIGADTSPDFLPERYDHSMNAESTQELVQKLEDAGANVSNVDFMKLLEQLGDAYLSESNYKEAIANYQRALSLRSKLNLADDDQKARTLIGLAASHEFLGQYDQAAVHAKEALKIREKVSGKDSALAYVALMRLGEIYRWGGKTKDCEDAYGQAAENAKKRQEWYYVLYAKQRLAEYLEEIDQLDKAETIAVEVLDLAESQFANDDNEKVKALNSLAEIQSRQKENKEAEENFTKALSLIDNADFDNSVDAIDAYTLFLWENNRKEEAKKKLKEFCAKLENRYRDEQGTLCSVLESLHTRLYGYTQTELGTFSAEKYVEQCKKYFGNRSEEYIRAMGMLATSYAKLDPKKFKSTIESAIKLANDNLPEKSPAREDLHERYADVLAEQQSFDAAEKEYMQAYRETESNDHSTAAKLLSARASMLRSLNKSQEARDAYATAISEAEKAQQDAEHYQLNLALIEMDAFKNYKVAAELLEKSIHQNEQHLGHGYSIEAVRPLIECYEKLGKKESIADIKKKLTDTYLKALALDEDKYGSENSRLIDDLEYCGDAYFTVGEFQQAEQYYLRSMKLMLKVDSKEAYAEQHKNNCKLLMAMCQAKLGRNDEAATNFQQAFQFFDTHKDENLDTEENVALETYASVLKKLNRKSEAVAIEKRIAAKRSA